MAEKENKFMKNKRKNWVAAVLLCAVLFLMPAMQIRAEEGQTTPPVALMQAKSTVNVRVGASTAYPVIGKLAGGQTIYAMGISPNGWYFVNYNGTAGYVSGNYLNATDAAASALMILPEGFGVPGAESAPAAAVAQPAQQTAPAAFTATATQTWPGTVTEIKQNGTWPGAAIVFIGDSRFVQMEAEVNVVTGGNPWAWVSEGGRGYDWFVEKGIHRADPVIGTGTRVVINLGVNDVRNADKYISYFNQKAAEWTMRGATVYYASVNPVWTNPYVTKEQVEAFNLKLQTNLAPYIRWIDSYSYIQGIGCRIVDGLHYDQATSLHLYNYYLMAVTQ